MRTFRGVRPISPFEIATALACRRPPAHHPLAMAQWQGDVLAIAQVLPEASREPFLLSCNWYPKHPSPLAKAE